MADINRLVAVVTRFASGASQVGSGYIVGAGLAVTAEHCVRHRETGASPQSLQLQRLDGTHVDIFPDALVTSVSADIAVIRFDASAFSDMVEPIQFGRVRRESGILEDCTVLGFPTYQYDSKAKLHGVAELHARIYQNEGRELDRLILRDPSVEPPPGGWGGLSGAVVTYREHALGVVTQHRPQQGSSALQAIAFEYLVKHVDPKNQDVARALGIAAADRLPWVYPQSQTPLAELIRVLDPQGDLPGLSELDPYRLGATISLVGDSTNYGISDSYLPRTANNVDYRVDSALTTGQGRLVVIVGPSKSGKTRTAFEAVRRTLPTAKLAFPEIGRVDDLAAHPRWTTTDDPIVVWLDSLYDYVTAQPPLTSSILERLRTRRGPVHLIATLRSEQRELLRGDSANNSVGEQREQIRLLLDQAVTIDLAPTSADPAEQAAAAKQYPTMPAHGGLAAQLAGAPELLRQYNDARYADPTRWFVVASVIDWFRVGRTDPIPERSLPPIVRQLMSVEYPERDISEQVISQAIQTSRTPPEGLGRVAMLTTTSSANGDRHYRPFDYLTATDDGQGRNARPIPDVFWAFGLQGADEKAAFSVASTANNRGQDSHAVQALKQMLSLLDATQSRSDLAKNVWLFLGASQLRTNPPDNVGAENSFESALQLGDSDIMYRVGSMYVELGSEYADTARRWMGRAAEAGETAAMLVLGQQALEAKPVDDTCARRWFRKAAEVGDPDGWFYLGVQCYRQSPSDIAGAVENWGRAAEKGHLTALQNLSFARRQGDATDIGQVHRWFETAVAGGSRAAAYHLGELCAEASPPDLHAARQWWEKCVDRWETVAGADTSPLSAMNALGLVCFRNPPADTAAATAWWTRAAEHGDAAAMWHLGALRYAQGGDGLAQARKWWEGAAKSIDSVPSYLLELECFVDEAQATGGKCREWQTGLPKDQAVIGLGELQKNERPTAGGIALG